MVFASEKLSNIININKTDDSLLSVLQVYLISFLFFIIKTEYKIRLIKYTELLNDERDDW